MASINYRLKSRADKEVSIYIVLVLGREGRLMTTTGFKIHPKNWKEREKDSPSQFGVPSNKKDGANKNLTSALDRLKLNISDALNLANSNGTIIDLNWLKNQIKKCFNRTSQTEIKETKRIEKENNLLKYIEHFIRISNTREQKDGTIGVKKSTICGYKRLSHVIDLFEKHTKKKLTLKTLDSKFERAFKRWMLDTQEYKPSYTGKTISRLNTVVKYAIYEGNEVNDHAQHIRVIKETKEVKDPTLTFEELKTIESIKLENESLNNSRKLLLLGCYTGLRYSDLIRVTIENIELRDDYYFIDIKSQKTGINVTIPVLEEAERIIKLGLPYKIIASQLNKDIKEICAKAKIKEPTYGYKEQKVIINTKTERRKVLDTYPKHELITTHTFRRSFATNYYKIVPTPVLMEITGHKKESSFYTYIGKPKDKDENAKLMLRAVAEMKAKKEQKTETPIKKLKKIIN